MSKVPAREKNSPSRPAPATGTPPSSAPGRDVISLYICVHIYIYIHTYIYTYMYACIINTCVYISIYTHTYMYVYTSACVW